MNTEKPERPVSGQMATQVIDGHAHVIKVPSAADLPESWVRQNTELKVLRGVVAAQDEKAGQKDHEIAGLRSTLSQFKKTNRTICSDKETIQRDLTSMELENDELKISTAQWRQKYVQCQAENREAEMEREEFKKINEQLQKDMDKSRKEVDKLQDIIEKLDQNMMEARWRNDSLEAELDVLLRERQSLNQKLSSEQTASEGAWTHNKDDSKRSSTRSSTLSSGPPIAERLASLEKQLLGVNDGYPVPIESSPHSSLEVGYDINSTRTDESSPDVSAMRECRPSALEKMDPPTMPQMDTVLPPVEEVPRSLQGPSITRSRESPLVSPKSKQPAVLKISPPESESKSTPVPSPSAFDRLLETLKLEYLSSQSSLTSPILDSEGSAGTTWVVQPTPPLEEIIQPLRPRQDTAIHTNTVPDLEQLIYHGSGSDVDFLGSPRRWSYAPISETTKSERLLQEYEDFRKWLLLPSNAPRKQQGQSSGRNGVGRGKLLNRQSQIESCSLPIRAQSESNGMMAVTQAELPFGNGLISQISGTIKSTMILQLLGMLICLVICYAYNEGQRQLWMQANNHTRKLIIGWRDEQWSGLVWLAKLLFTLENWARLDRAKMA